MKKNHILAITLLSAMEGLIALLPIFMISSEAENAWLWGFSQTRITLGGGMLAVVLILLCFGFFLLLGGEKTTGFLMKIEDFFESGNHLLITVLTFIDILIIDLLFVWAAHAPMGNLSPFAVRALSAGVWGTLLILQVLGLLVFSYWDKLRQSAFWNRETIKRTILILVLLSFAFAQWVILIFRIPVFSSQFGWFWKFMFKTDYYHFDWLVPLLLAAFLIIANHYLKNPHISFLNLLPLVLFGALLQFSFAFIEGGSFEVIRESYAKSPHKFYAEFASAGAGLLETIKNYEMLLGKDSFAGTKPPGLVGLYILLERISFAINPSTLAHERFYRLTRLIAWTFPFVSILVVYPLSSLGKRFLRKENAVIPALLYLCLPNVILIQLYMDQTLYPLLFVLVIWLIVRAVDRNALIYSIAAGLLLYLSIFISFSLIPAVFIAFMLIGLHGLFAWTGYSVSIVKTTVTVRTMWPYIKLGLGALVGLGVLHLLFRGFFHYDVMERYASAISIHRELKNYDTGLGGVFPSILLNNSDYGVWTGTSILILALLAMVRSLVRIIKKSLTDFDWLSLSFLITYLAINIAGQTGGETGRLWIFLSPFLALLAAERAPEIFKKREYGVYMIIILQFITTVLTLKYQDFFGG